MKFITEEDLRDLYRKEPFKDFALEQGARMTPGARQFLIDKGINTFDSESFRGKEKSEEGKPKATEPEKKFDRKHKKLYCT
jgi:ethanolamine utilization cobalamin adenosyltransferase